MTTTSARLSPINLPTDSGVNLNQTNLELIYDVRTWANVSVQLVTTGGTIVLTIERSNDGSTPNALESATTLGPGNKMTVKIDCSGFGYLHVRATTLEGSAMTGNIIVLAKNTT